MLEAIKDRVWRACQRLVVVNLVIQTEGNVSERTPDGRFFVIKPSGVPYVELQPDHFVVVDLEGRVREGKLKPSTDTPTHLEIYRRRPDIGAICHTHSPYASAWAQMGTPLPCFGTTHADAFGGAVPVTRLLTPAEVVEGYERAIGRVIAEVLPQTARAVLVAGHGPFSFGENGLEAVRYAEILEKVAMMATVNRPARPLPAHILHKHYDRKHGAGRYYGQEGEK
ncbi:MAG: class II aldolase/adducin family protein [bacterium]|nr:class II aldolase/adducin family protein [bacterium]